MSASLPQPYPSCFFVVFLMPVLKLCWINTDFSFCCQIESSFHLRKSWLHCCGCEDRRVCCALCVAVSPLTKPIFDEADRLVWALCFQRCDAACTDVVCHSEKRRKDADSHELKFKIEWSFLISEHWLFLSITMQKGHDLLSKMGMMYSDTPLTPSYSHCWG